MTKLRVLVLVAALALLAPLVAATASARQDAGTGTIDVLTLGDFGGGSNPQANFNPYSTNFISGATIWMFEPLMSLNQYSCVAEPWLATEFNWSDPQTLNFTIRDGVTWTDGTPFTANDVVFSFKMTQAFPALDTDQLWQFAADVVANGNIVTFTFNEPGGVLFNRIIDNPILPAHLWQGVEDPVTFLNEEPVGTGPFTIENFSSEELTMVRNPNYWQADKVKVERLSYAKGQGDAQIDQLRLAEGRFDWQKMFMPDIENSFVAKDPEHNKYWFPAGGSVSLMMNHTEAPMNDVNFRRAIAYAFDRQSMADRAAFGYSGPASQTLLTLPNQSIFLDESIPDQGFIPYNPDMARQILQESGYTYDGDELKNGEGDRVSVTFSVQSEWTDYVQAAEIVRENLEAIGIEVNVEARNPDLVGEDRKAGLFQMTFDAPGGSCNLYDSFFYTMAGADAPVEIGTNTDNNWSRWADPESAQLLTQLRNAATQEEQLPAIHGLQQIMVNELPFIPLWYAPVWLEYQTDKAVGWPSAEDPYAGPGNDLIILTHLTPSPDYQPGS